MILPNPDYRAPLVSQRPQAVANQPQALCHQREAARHLREAVLLLHRPERGAAEDADLMRAAMATWECAALSGIPTARISAGLLLAQTQLVLGQAQAAVVTAERVRRFARGTPQAAPAATRALLVGAKAWHQLGNAANGDHLLALARVLVETCNDPDERCRLREQCDLVAVDPTITTTATSASPLPKP